MNRGGVETMLMNYYRSIDRSRLQFDFLVHSPRPGHFDGEVRDLGGRIWNVGGIVELGPVSYVRAVCRVLRAHGPFVALHEHMDAPGALSCLAARLSGVPRRIAHSHNTAPRRATPRRTIQLEEHLLKRLIVATATHYCACGRAAAEFLFGARAKRACLIPNALDVSPFEEAWAFDRGRLRADLGIPGDAIAIVHVASFTPPKNQRFTIELVLKLRAAGLPALGLLVGDGPLRPELEAQFADAHDHVRFLGVRSDVAAILRASDLFLMPSLFEGLPVAVLEAQAAGLPCLLSDAITEEVDLGLGLVNREDLDADTRVWVSRVRELIRTPRPSAFEEVRPRFRLRGLDASAGVDVLYRLYGLDDVPTEDGPSRLTHR